MKTRRDAPEPIGDVLRRLVDSGRVSEDAARAIRDGIERVTRRREAA